MISPQALSATRYAVKPEQVERDARIVTEFVDYIRWLADQDTGLMLSVGDLWSLYHDGVLQCRYWSEVCEDIGLPVRDDWID